ncbi:hypothetical protein [Amycolatopsis samaneae]|uniref:Uncharacterized protein n=1 Tax=Amycolatopsis samaneae TaxID=664691 RepID=A0ABW5GEM2_9PSEU
MTKLRSLVVTGLLGLVVLCAAPAQAAPVANVRAVSSPVLSVSAPSPGTARVALAQQPPGPVLDPAETDKANKEKSRNKIIAGVVAALLLLIVILGRRQRKKAKAG